MFNPERLSLFCDFGVQFAHPENLSRGYGVAAPSGGSVCSLNSLGGQKEDGKDDL
jgi:hypothetical protein